MKYENEKQVHLMIWETLPEKRNINNEIKFNLKKEFKAEVGDEICCYIDQQKESVYTLTEIVDDRQSSLEDYNYVTAKSSWKIRNLNT